MNPLSYFISKRSIKAPPPIANTYQCENPLTGPPIIPCMTFGLYFDCDYVFCMSEGPYSMLEISSTYIGEKKIWFTLESKPNGEQIAGYNKLDEKEVTELFSVLKIKSYLNEITVTEDDKFYFVNYSNKEKKSISLKLRRSPPSNTPFFLNGNTMNHSKDLGLFSIFLSSLKYNRVCKNDIPFSLQKLLGIPMSFKISQTVFGCAATSFQYQQVLNENNEVIIGDNLFSKFHFIKNNDYYELKSIQSFHKYKDTEKKTGELVFASPLPDLRFLNMNQSFSQNASIKINGKHLSHLKFTITRTSRNLVYSIKGTSPSWIRRSLKGVQMKSVINYRIENE